MTLLLISLSCCLFVAITWTMPAGPLIVPQSHTFNFGVNYTNRETNRPLMKMLGNAGTKLAAALNESLNFAVSRSFNITPVRTTTFPPSGRVKPRAEAESKLSMLDSAYSHAHQWVAGLFNHRPIVDTIQEHEKYGNDGDKYRSFGTAVVNGFEGLSNFLNTAVEVPFTVMKQITNKANTILNGIGGKVTGL